MDERSVPSLGGFWEDMNTAIAAVELYFAVDEGEERPVAAGADVIASAEPGAALADDDTAGSDELAAESFDTETFADAVAAVPATASTFLMSHG
jgi:hypothetical protein